MVCASFSFLFFSRSLFFGTQKLCCECEIDQKKFNEGIKEIRIKNKLKDLTSFAFNNDVFGAPTFVVNNKLFWGQDRLNYALDEYNS